MRWFQFFAVAAFLTSCSTVTTFENITPTKQPVRADGTYRLPRTVFNVKVIETKGVVDLTITRAVEPDPATDLRYRINMSPLSFDDVKIDLANDMLSAVTSSATDNTGDIALNLAELVFTTSTGGSTLPTGIRSFDGAPPGTGVNISSSYDPLNPEDVARTRAALLEGGYCIAVGAETLVPPEQLCDTRVEPVVDHRYAAAAKYGKSIPGIYFRRTVSVPVMIYRRIAKNPRWHVIFTGNEQVFDKTALYQIDFNRALFVQKKITVHFASGSLADIAISQPSTVAAATMLPVKIARIIFAIPLAGLQRDTALLNAQTDNIKAQTSLLSAQVAYMDLVASQSADTARAFILPNDAAMRSADTLRFMNVPQIGRVMNQAANSSVEACRQEAGFSAPECADQIARDQP